MKLGDWRRQEELTQQGLADLLGTVISTVARYEIGSRVPERDTMLAIFHLSKGQVQPNDFYDLPSFVPERDAA